MPRRRNILGVLSRKPNTRTSLLSLPNELLFLITSFLSCQDVYYLILQNRRLANLLQDTLYDLLFMLATPYAKLRKALRRAIKKNHPNVLSQLLARGISKTVVYRMEYPLHTAIKHRHIEIIKLLLTHTSAEDVSSCTNYNRETPLHLAVLKRRIEIIKLLLAHGVNPNFCFRSHPALHITAENGFNDVVKVLLEHGAEVNFSRPVPFITTPLHIAVKASYRLVITATKNDPLLVVQTLLDHGADASAADYLGMTAIHYASIYGRNFNREWAIHMGKGWGVWRLRARVKSKEVHQTHKKIIDLLVQSGADINACDKQGGTALSLAVDRCEPYIVRNLVALGADVNALVRGQSMLHLAVDLREKAYAKDTMRALIESGADLNARCVSFGNLETPYEAAKYAAEYTRGRASMKAASQLLKLLKPPPRR